MKIAAIHQPQCLPYLGFFDKLASCDVFVAMDEAQFQRRGVQHRNKIKTKDGWQWLTVPVVRSHGYQPTRDVEIDFSDSWQRRHWNAIRTNYGAAPFFDPYGAELKALLSRPWRKLCDSNMTLLRWTPDRLGIRMPVVLQSELGVAGTRSELLAAICVAVGADDYLSGPGGRRYVDEAAFQGAGVALIWQDFTCPLYDQVFPELGFVGDLSVIDALFVPGPKTTDLLGQSST
jgi:hypothetical protein